MRLGFSPAAKRDLLDIAAFIARDDPVRAVSFIEELEARCRTLLSFPERAQARPELADSLRSLPHGRYLIFYTPIASEVRIERIVHGSRDLGNIFR